MDLTEQVKARARELGADLVGVAPVERFAGAPLRMSPEGLLPGATCVVVAGIHHLDAAVELGGVPTPHDIGPYRIQFEMNSRLDDISFQLGRFLEAQGWRALPVAVSNIWRYHGWKDCAVDFAPDLAHRYAAVAAGLAEIGWSGLAMSPEFGPRNRFVSIVTDAPLDATPMYAGDPLCDKCMQCVETCPTDAFRKEVRCINEIAIGGRTFTFPATNKWRCAWAENFCLDLAHAIPETVDESVILATLEKHGMRGGEEGCCLQFCMNPQNRYYDESYCRPPRRKKAITERDGAKLLADVERVLAASGADVWAVGDAAAFDEEPQVNPRAHLPDARTLISVGFTVPEHLVDSGAFMNVLRRRMHYVGFDVGHVLDLAGYSAVPATTLFNERVAGVLGVYETDMHFTTVLTSAGLPAKRDARPKASALADADAIRRFCTDAGADLVGVFSTDRFDAFLTALEAAGLVPPAREVVEDTGMIYGPYVPRTRKIGGGVGSPRDHLAGARSVIVLGLHFPDDALDTAKVTPAETVGPFTFVRYEGQLLLGDIAFSLIKALGDAGHRATLTYDLTGLASEVHTSRRMLSDMRASRFAAALAGLAHIGVHGMPITPEFGTRQVFIAVVTDMVLPNDPLYAGTVTCATCEKPCITACPTNAVAGETVAVAVDGASIAIPRIDVFACDWATRYCLAGEEGPRYCGLEVDVPLPQERTAKGIANAVSAVNWGVQKRHTNIVEECLRVCPAKGTQRGTSPE